MGRRSRHELVLAVYARYRRAAKAEKTAILEQLCAATGYNRKYAIALLRNPPEPKPRARRRRRSRYGPEVLAVLLAIWEAAGYPWSVRLKALVPLWLPWAKKRMRVGHDIETKLQAISPRTIDRRLASEKKRIGRRLYGRTKPGTLLKHQIPIQTRAWEVDRPGYGEMDLVAHSGSSAAGEFAHSLNFTDIASTWVETRAVLGKAQSRVHHSLEEILAALPFPTLGLDSDNGSEFINEQLVRFCQSRKIQLTRSRPYKKDDNAHIEQKNWTHVRRLLGWQRFDTEEAVAAMNDLYRNELHWMQNLFQPSVKLVRKVRRGSRVLRRYDRPQTPIDRLATLPGANQVQVTKLRRLRAGLDPFALANAIERKLEHIQTLAASSRDQRLRRRAG